MKSVELRETSSEIMETVQIQKEEVLAVLRKIKVDKSPGPDRVFPRTLKETSVEIAGALAEICRCLQTETRKHQKIWVWKMIRKLYFLLSVLRVTPAAATKPEEWKASTFKHVSAPWGTCARIPCNYTYPMHLANKSRTAIWINGNTRNLHPVVFHSENNSRVSLRFQHRANLSGDLKDNDCSLVINNVEKADGDYTDTPSIFPVVLDAGKPVDISCTFNFKCNGSTPNFKCNGSTPIFTWHFPAGGPLSAPASVVLQRHWTFTSVWTLTPELKYHGQNLSCRVRYPPASSEQIVTLTVRSPTSVQSSVIIPLTTAAAVVFLIISSAVIGFIVKARWRTDRPAECASRPASKEASRPVTWRKRQMQEEVPKCPETTLKVNEYQDIDIYANCQPAESSIYGNI
ncbi:uncharacterized protein LOC134350212 isoform X2 [Mobula hypostoma]|uniref:uncharacterized protein LOC134350212 isoform X2 n=1 Tax=Mobula hypostoma TaxID=723540 RepID=UPI002FC2D210